MPDSPRPSIAFPAFQTPAGLLPQADREQRSDYAATQNMAAELSRRTDGYWIDVPYAPSRFLAYNPGGSIGAVWQVQKKDVGTYRYKLVGSQLHLIFNVYGTLLNAQTGHLYIGLPDRFRARKSATSSLWGYEPVTGGVGMVAITGVGQTQMSIYLESVGYFAVGSKRIEGQALIEVEEQ